MLEKSIVLLAALYTLCTILEVLHEKKGIYIKYIYIYMHFGHTAQQR